MTFKSLALPAAAAVAAVLALAPLSSAEASYGRNGWLAAGLVGGAILGATVAASSRPAAGRVIVHEGPDCYRIRERIWDEYRGRYVSVRRTVCE